MSDAVWTTFRTQRTVLMACRTLTSTIRLLETHELFRGDDRLDFVYAIDTGSRFHTGAERLLTRAGVDDIVAWSEVDTLRPHLTLAASENVEPAAVSGPIMVLPHGIGFNKYVPTADGAARRLAGLPSTAALRSGRVRVALAHPEQETQLRAVCPDIAGTTVITGDATFDQLEASRPLRDRYRRLLHGNDLHHDHRLVLVSSTWGAESTLGRWRTLPRRLVAELPADRYRVCLALHPNIWAYHGRRAVRVYLADALDAGLVLLPPESGWHAAMIAADVVVADHGSLSMYAAGLGTPLLLVGSAGEGVPSTPMAQLSGTALRLVEHVPLAPQLEAAISAPHNDFRTITDRVFDHRGRAVTRLRAEVYRAVDLPPPGRDAPLLRVPDPTPERRGPWSFRVFADEHTDEHGRTVTLTRYPAAAHGADGTAHLVVTDAEVDMHLAEQASVLCRPHRTGRTQAQEWSKSALLTRPGARLAAAGVTGGCVAVCRDGRQATMTAPNADASALASLAYHLVVAGRLRSGTVTLALGLDRVRVEITTD